MEFEGQYLTYEEYKGLGGTLDQTPFNILEFESRRLINTRTQDRINVEDIPQEVKLCEFEMINTIQKYLSSTDCEKGNIASESIDGYSISYIGLNQASSVVRSKETELTDIIRTYLLGVLYDGQHLLYVGIDDK